MIRSFDFTSSAESEVQTETGPSTGSRQDKRCGAGSSSRADSLRKQPYTRDVFQLFASFRKGKKMYVGKTHLIFQAGTPVAVLKWEDVEGGKTPAILVPLERESLQGPYSGIEDHTYCYLCTIDWQDAQFPTSFSS
jgi:hypothetical protein